MQESITASAGFDYRQKEPTNKLWESSCNIFAQISYACSFTEKRLFQHALLLMWNVLLAHHQADII